MTANPTLATAIRNGRVSALTAPARSIRKLVRLGHLKPAALAGIYEPTELGLCVAGRCPF